MTKEIKALELNQTWSVIDLPPLDGSPLTASGFIK